MAWERLVKEVHEGWRQLDADIKQAVQDIGQRRWGDEQMRRQAGQAAAQRRADVAAQVKRLPETMAKCRTMMKSLAAEQAEIRKALQPTKDQIREQGRAKLADFVNRATALAESGRLTGEQGAHLDAAIARLAETLR
jgi:hypothetical protein